MGKEAWKVIPGFEPYEVSTRGRVRKPVKNGYQMLKIGTMDTGYQRACLQMPGGQVQMTVHRLVAMTFIDNPDHKPCINHIDCNKANNNIWNLEWCTYSENTIHAVKHGKFDQRKVIGTNLETGEEVVFDGINETKEYGFCPSNVCNCCKGQRSDGSPVYTHKGYAWRYAD